MKRAFRALLILLLLGVIALGWGFVVFLDNASMPAEAVGVPPTAPRVAAPRTDLTVAAPRTDLTVAAPRTDSTGAAPRTEAIVVLTGGAERVETALLLLEAGWAPRLLVSGANAGLTLPELARAHGRDPRSLEGRVTLGRAAATTLGNAVEVAAYVRALDISSIRLVTAGYHMPRALLELRRVAPGLDVRPHPVMPALLHGGVPGNTRVISTLRRWTLLPGEYLKYVAAAAGLTRFMPAKEQALR